MVSVPRFLLRQLYVKGSLKNTSEGFEFQLKNRLGSGYTHKMYSLILDGTKLQLDSTFFVLDKQETKFSSISHEKTFTLPMNKIIRVYVNEITLEPGSHTVEMRFDVPGLGTLKLDFTDLIENE